MRRHICSRIALFLLVGATFWMGAAEVANAATVSASTQAASAGSLGPAPSQCVEAFPIGGDYGAVACTPW